MSRTRTYGKSIAVRDIAIQQAEGNLLNVAYDRLWRHFTEQSKLLRALGVDVASITEFERQEVDQVVVGYTVRGRQRRNVFQRILWAIKL